MFTKMFWVAGVFLDVYGDVLVAGVFLDVYKDVLGCWGASRCLQRCSGCWVVSRCLLRCSGLLGCFYMFIKMFWVAGVFLYVY